MASNPPTPPPPGDAASQFSEGVAPHADAGEQFSQGVAPHPDAAAQFSQSVAPKAESQPAPSAPAKPQQAPPSQPQGKPQNPVRNRPPAQKGQQPQSAPQSGAHGHTRVLVLNGPNLNLLGQREPEIYGTDTLDDLEGMLKHIAERHDVELIFEQSNHEGQLIDWIHDHIDDTEGLIINPGAYTHTSYALRDALAAYPHEIVEVHLSNIHNREEFREKSVVAPMVTGTISGFGMDSYRLALLWLVKHLEKGDQ